jgi:hypothetical protein
MRAQFLAANLHIQQQLAVSHFRIHSVKEKFSAAGLARTDSFLYGLGGRYPLSPSVFIQATAPGARTRAAVPIDSSAVVNLFRCPQCGAETWELVSAKQLLCQECDTKYEQKDGIWDFKEAVV